MLRLEGPRLSLLECLIFGSTLSATDPVTILAIFNTYRVDPQLYSIIFGESILNDAVSIVMFETLSKFRNTTITLFSLFHGFGLFAVVFSISLILGVLFGLSCSLLLKHSRLGLYPELESCVVMLLAYTSYFFSNAVQMSGIVSLLFCGITLKHYAYHNMSRRTQRTTKYIFQTLASLSENFIFIYLGLSLFTGEHLVYHPLLIVFTLVAVVASRYTAVFPIAYVLNRVSALRARHRQRASGAGLPEAPFELPREYQLMLFWAGLRGAVGFALSAGMEGPNAYALQTTVLVVVVLTVIVFGGTTAQMLDVLQIQTGVEDDEDEASSEEEADLEHWPGASRRAGHASEGAMTPTPSARYRDVSSAPDANEVLPDHTQADLPQAMVAGPGGLRSLTRDELLEEEGGALDPAVRARHVLDRANLIFQDGQWFQRIDERYLLPMFSNTVANRRHEQRKEQLQARRAASREVGDESTAAWANLAVPYEREAEGDAEPARAPSPKDKTH